MHARGVHSASCLLVSLAQELVFYEGNPLGLGLSVQGCRETEIERGRERECVCVCVFGLSGWRTYPRVVGRKLFSTIFRPASSCRD